MKRIHYLKDQPQHLQFNNVKISCNTSVLESVLLNCYVLPLKYNRKIRF
jgi:hypothetical protein